MLMNLIFGQSDIREILISLLLMIPIFCISFSVHEAAHAYVAFKLGDPTARNLGRLTLNPLKHLDPIGTISMLLIGIGYGKPVPINSRYFKKPKRDMAISSAAGPVSNLLLALLGVILYQFLLLLASKLGWGIVIDTPRYAQVLATFLSLFSWINVSLAVFNLIPIPPFDGSRIAFAILPDRYYWKVMQYERYIMIGLIAAIFVLNRILPVSPVSLIADKILDGLFFLTRWIALL